MKVVFVGPSLPDATEYTGPSVEIRPPAVQSDILNAVREGATVIGLIDGGFEYTAPVWHKEILYALSKGVVVAGAASMGALRAAECQSFGMVGVGRIFDDYASGAVVDDAAVALLHAPKELGFRAMTVPIVNIRATVERLRDQQIFSAVEAQEIEEIAATLFFKRRTWSAFYSQCAKFGRNGAEARSRICHDHYVDQKRLDAIRLMRLVANTDRGVVPAWIFQKTSLWRN
jgi:hypothetical protein